MWTECSLELGAWVVLVGSLEVPEIFDMVNILRDTISYLAFWANLDSLDTIPKIEEMRGNFYWYILHYACMLTYGTLQCKLGNKDLYR